MVNLIVVGLPVAMQEKVVQVVFTAIDHASSNGLIERGQTLVNRIRCKINAHKSWATKECTEEYNRTTHTVTRFAPNYLLFGQKTNLCPIDLIVNDLEKHRKLAFENSTRNFEWNKKRVDQVKKYRPCEPVVDKSKLHTNASQQTKAKGSAHFGDQTNLLLKQF